MCFDVNHSSCTSFILVRKQITAVPVHSSSKSIVRLLGEGLQSVRIAVHCNDDTRLIARGGGAVIAAIMDAHVFSLGHKLCVHTEISHPCARVHAVWMPQGMSYKKAENEPGWGRRGGGGGGGGGGDSVGGGEA